VSSIIFLFQFTAVGRSDSEIALFLRNGLQRVEARAAAEGFVEGGAEVAEAAVANFKGGFGHVAAAGAEEFGGAFHADLAQVLLDGGAGFLGEGAAQIEGAGADLFAEFFKGGWFGEVFAEDLADAFDAVAGDALGAGAEEFAAGGFEEEVGGEFKGFAAEPDFAGGLEDGALLEAFDELEVEGAEAFGGGDASSGGGAGDDVADEGVEVVFLGGEMFAEEGGGEFDSDEAMFFVGFANGAQAGFALVIKKEGAGAEFDFGFAVFDGAGAVEVEAEFDAFGMEGAGPVEGLGGGEFVPFEAEAEVVEAAEKGSPAAADGMPGGGFSEGVFFGASHAANLRWNGDCARKSCHRARKRWRRLKYFTVRCAAFRFTRAE
jgi:hypothetical protein